MTIERRLARSTFRELGEGNYGFAIEHLHDLVSTVDDVGFLDAAILQLAVTGRLSDRREDDEPAETFLAKIESETLDQWPLVDAKGRPRLEPYPLPPKWQWVMLGSLLIGIEAGWSPSAQGRPKKNEEWGVLKVSACSWGRFLPDQNKALAPGQQPRSELEVRNEDFLISRANTAELVARSVIVDETPPHLMLSDKTLRLDVVTGCNRRYLNLANRANAARMHYEKEASGTSSSMKNVSQRAIRRAPIPLPPKEEQERIVRIINELQLLTEAMKNRLQA